MVTTVANPVSVAFGENHLYVLGAEKVESHSISGDHVNGNADGVATLLVADGSAAQVGVLTNQLVVTEKSTSSRPSPCLRTELSPEVLRLCRAFLRIPVKR